MPFKTRKRKESAAERRFTFVENKVVYEDVPKGARIDKDLGKARFIEPKKIAETVNTGSDLLKIISAAGIIVGIQIILRLTLSL